MRNKNRRFLTLCLSLIICFSALLILACKPDQKAEVRIPVVDVETLKSRLILKTEVDPKTGTDISRGTFSVFEDRVLQKGRMIKLDVVVLHAIGTETKPDPVFYLAGGPGADVTQNERGLWGHWIRKERDIVLVSQRGTGGDNKLDCAAITNDDNIQGYLDPLFNVESYRLCYEELKKNYDLTKYSTCLAADDLNEIRVVLGYDTINLMGGSYGTRMAFVYMRRHPKTVRSATLNGVAPIAFKNPLFHAPAIQEALQLLFAECANDPDSHKAYPNFEDEFRIVIQRLDESPANVTVSHPVTKESVPVKLNREAFVESTRTMMYMMDYNRRIPYLVHKAFEGDYEPFAQLGLETERMIRKMLATGMLLSVTCAEDLDRISETEIEDITGGTFMGDGRVRRQKAVCEFWPRSVLPNNYGDPVSVDVPVLLLSGIMDPVTPPRWGKAAASHLPHSLHLVVPGSHGVGGKCILAIQKQFLETGSVEELDISCTESMKLPRFRIPKH
ncbi:alpha/beta hydrolase [Acidobacteriota bacterium]